MTIELILLIAAGLLVTSIVATRASKLFGVPALLLFLLIGMLAGSEGPGGIAFEDYWQTQFIGVCALVVILFSGGLDTDWPAIKPVLGEGLVLANLGVVISTLLVGTFAMWLLDVTWLEGLLLGAVISSTDAAAVFSVMRERGVNLKRNLEPLIELESGSNDPIAVFLTIGIVGLLTNPATSFLNLIVMFVLQMLIGAGGGFLMGRVMGWTINHVRLQQEGLYAVFTMALMILTYGLTAVIGGNGFLAVYVAGIVLGNTDFVHKRSILRFHDGLAWLMQIAMFLTLGLLVFPSEVFALAGSGLVVALFLVFVARPLSVFGALIWFRRSWADQLMVAWAGLRGAVPIVLATFPLISGVPGAKDIFNLVFFIVIVSVLLQGISIPWVANLLKVNAPKPQAPDLHTFVPDVRIASKIVEAIIPDASSLIGKALIELGLPRGVLVVQIQRGPQQVLPNGATILEPDDHLMMLVTPDALPHLEQLRSAGAVRLITAKG